MQILKRVIEGGRVKSAQQYRRNFVRARKPEGLSTQQNSEKPPLDRAAERARDCVGQAAIMRA